MNGLNPHSTASIAGHPIHPMLVPFPIVFFVSTLVTDIVFQRTGNGGWSTASTWLLGAGLVTAALAALAGLTDFLGESRIRHMRPAWLHMTGNVIAVLLSLANFLLRLNGGEVVPTGLTLSAVVAVLLVFNGWMGWEMVYRRHVGIAD